MRRLRNWDRSRIVSAFRAAAVIVSGYGFWLILHGSDPHGIWVSTVGAVLWAGGTWIRERSPDIRLLMTTPARTVMRTEVIRVPSSRSVAGVLRLAAGLDGRSYVLTLLDGRECGLALVEQIRAIPESEAHHTPIYSVARPISYAKCLSREDAVIEAFRTLKRGTDDFVAVLNASDQVAGVITRDDLARALAPSNGSGAAPAAAGDSELPLAA